MKKHILFIAFTLCISLIFAQNINIKGVTEKNALIRIFSVNDAVTNLPHELAQTHSDSRGNFEISAPLKQISMVQIAVNLNRVDFLAKPNAQYQVEISIPETDENISYFEQKLPVLTIIKTNNENGLAQQYVIAQNIIDDFISQNANTLFRTTNTKKLDTIDLRISKKITHLDPFVKDYIFYRKNEIAMGMKHSNGTTSLDKKPFLLQNPGFCSFFVNVFGKYLKNNRFITNDLLKSIHEGRAAALNYLKQKDSFFAKNSELSEAALAINLKRMYYENGSQKKSIFRCLQSISQNGQSASVRLLASNIIEQINTLSFGSEAPSFALSDGIKTFNINDFSNVITVIQFVNRPSEMINYQFGQLAQLVSRWGAKVNVVTITTKDGFAATRKLFDEEGYTWTLLNLGDDILLLEKYHIRTFPDYVIILPEGKIGMSPAPSPDQYLEYHVNRLMR